MIRRMLVLGWMTLVFLTCLLLGADSSYTSAAEKVRFASHLRTSAHYHLPVIAALDRGFWKQQGLEVQWIIFKATGPTQRAVAAKKIEMGTSGITGLVRAVATGVPQILLAEFATSPFYFYVLKDSPLKLAKDIKGNKISITRFGGDLQAFSLAVIRALGLEKEVKIVAAGGVPARIAALKSGAAHITIGTFMSMLGLIVKGEVRVLLNVDDYVPKGLRSNIVFARTDFLKKKPEVARKIVKGFFRGGQFAMKNPKWAMGKMKTDYRFTDQMAKLAHPRLNYDPKGTIDESKIRNNIRFLVDNGLITKDKVPPMEKLRALGFTP